MECGFVVMIAYERLVPSATFADSLGGWHVKFERKQHIQHKVVFSGFQPGPFPLLINDVGSGSRHKVRLVTGLVGRGFGHQSATGSAIKKAEFPPWPDGKWTFQGSKQIYLAYENDNSPTEVVRFIQHIDALSLDWRRPHTVWNGRWGTGWSHFMPFVHNGDPHFIAYNKDTGEVHFDRVSPSLQGSQTLWSARWAAGWTHFVPFVLNARPHFFAYNQNDGTIHFDRFRSDLQGPEIVWAGRWGRGWSNFMPFVHNGEPHFIAYNEQTGEVHFDRVSPSLKGSQTMWSARWGSGWSDFVPFSLGGRQHFIAYNKATGELHFDRVWPNLHGSETLWSEQWAKGWSLKEVSSRGVPHFVAYNADTGAMHLHRVRAGGRGYAGLYERTTMRGFSTILPFRLGVNSYQLYYERSSGIVSIFKTAPVG